MSTMRRILVGMVMVLVLAACGGDDGSSAPPDEMIPGVTTTTVDVPLEGSKSWGGSDEAVEVGRWTGTNDTDTPNFTVEGAWELHWNISGTGPGALVAWYTPEGRIVDDLSMPPGSGQSLTRGGGTFYLEISVYNDAGFEIWAVDVPG